MIILLVSFASLLITAYLISILFSIGDESDDSKKDTDKIQYEKHYCILVLLAEVMKTDKENMKCELDKIKEYILCAYKTEKEQTEALKQFQAILNDNNPDLDGVCKFLSNHLSFQDKSAIIWNLLAIANADENDNVVELETIKKIYTGLNLLPSDYSAIYIRFMEEHRYNKVFKGDGKDKASDIRYFILVLLAEVMKADGEMLVSELDRVKSTIRRYFNNESEQKIALKQFQAILENKHYINDVCNQINMLLNATSKTEIVMELMAVAYADGIFNETEVSVINSIITDLNLSSYKKSIYTIFMRKYNQGFYKSQSSSNQEYKKEKNDNSNNKSNYKKASDNNYSNKSLDESFDILGLPHNASDEEIKKAYRALAKEYHPDKFSALGDEAIRQATETMKQINKAWDVVKMARGIK